MRTSGELGEVDGPGTRFAIRIFINQGEFAASLDLQAEAVKVDVCVSLPETVMCVAFTPGEWELASMPYCPS